MKPPIAPLLAAAALLGNAAPGLAQVSIPSPPPTAWPSKIITLVVPTAAGGANDVMARSVAQKLGPLLGQPVLVDNRAGANGAIAAEFVAHAAPDGHTLLLGYIATHGMNPARQALRYDPVADFTPISLLASSPTLMVANTSAPVKDVRDLVAQLKARPDSYTYASAGNGTAPHFAAELFKLHAGVVMLGVPYKGAAPAISDTISGQTQFMFPSLFTALPFVQSGKLRALAVAGPKRLDSLPDVPTLQEAGVDGVDVTQWYAIFAPAKLPRPIVDKLNTALGVVLTDKDLIKRLADHGADVRASTPDALATLVKTELAKWRQVVQATRLTAE